MTKITREDLSRAIDRISEEAETQARFNGVEFVGLTEEEIVERLRERLGNNWELLK